MLIRNIAFAASVAALSVPAVAGVSPALKAKPVKYCIKSVADTGSRMRVTQCMTKAEWSRRGVDVDQLDQK